MKAERKEEKQFIPVVLTLESQHEVDAIFAVLNHATFSNRVLNFSYAYRELEPFASPNYHEVHQKIILFGREEIR